ncbi:MAG: peroxiredoxin family protein [Phycisphaerales bacterium]
MHVPVFSACFVLAVSATAGADDTCVLKPLPSGVRDQIRYYRPQRVVLSAVQPESVKKTADGAKAPLFGIFPVTSAVPGRVFVLMLDEPVGGPARLWVDADGDGDLTNDAPADWKPKEVVAKDGTKFVRYEGGASLKLGLDDKPFDARMFMYRFDKGDLSHADQKDLLLFCRDYGTEGDVKIGGKTYKVLLLDDLATGDFRGKEIKDNKSGSGVMMWIDINGNGKFDRRGESYDVRKPFNIGGTTYEITDIARDGTSFRVIKSSKTVDEIPPPPDLDVGKVFPPSNAKSMDGRDVKFPSDYKGKIVMVDFWATWCEPCMAEVPGLVAAYDKFHDQGFEVLGVSLDQKDAVEKIKKITGEKKMTWPQIYDGKGWDAELARKYAVDVIPATFLVDGDTGAILAKGNQLRGEALEPTLKKHLDAVNKRKN